MKKFGVFSGFLGSGKTTTMIALTRYYTEKYGKAAMISNDLGHGVNLADNRLAELSGANASEMTETCICYQNKNLADRINSYYDDGCELVYSDIPGFGVGALEHVYHGLSEKFPGVYDLAPFTVLVEPNTVHLLQGGNAGDIGYIYNAQLLEADLIVLNKCDLISSDEKASLVSWLAAEYPEAKIVGISALTGDGMDDLAVALRDGSASMRHPELGYGGAAFMKAMGHFSEYYYQYIATVCCNDFDCNAYLMDLAEEARAQVLAAGHDIPHLKLLAWDQEGDYGKVDLIGAGRKIECIHEFSDRHTTIAVILNASGDCPDKLIDEIITGAAQKISINYQLDLIVHKKEFFGMG